AGRAPREQPLRSKEQQEKQDALAKGFVELARVARDRTAIRKDHRPGNLRRAAVELAIDEICDPAKKEADRDSRGDDVRKRKKRDLERAREQQDGERHTESAAVERHPDQ